MQYDKNYTDPLDSDNQINTLVGDIRLDSIIGEGSFAVVFLGIQIQTKEKFAVKCLYKTGLSKHQREIQYEEVKILQTVEKAQNINKLLKVVETNDHLFLVLEYCDSDVLTYLQSLEDNCATRIEEAKRMFNEIAGAVCGLHDLSDLKPENILIKNGKCYICDFGLATMDILSTEFGCGSFRYMSPECNGEYNFADFDTYTSDFPIKSSSAECMEIEHESESSQRSPTTRNSNDLPLPYLSAANDVWSLGVILLNLLTGKNPWNDPSLTDKHFRKHFFPRKEQKVDSLMKKFGFSQEFTKLLRKVFNLDPLKRPSCRDLIKQVNTISRFFENEEVSFGLLTPPEDNIQFFPVDTKDASNRKEEKRNTYGSPPEEDQFPSDRANILVQSVSNNGNTELAEMMFEMEL